MRLEARHYCCVPAKTTHNNITNGWMQKVQPITPQRHHPKVPNAWTKFQHMAIAIKAAIQRLSKAIKRLDTQKHALRLRPQAHERAFHHQIKVPT